MITETLDLYTTKDVAQVRAQLMKEQHNLSAMTGLPLTKPVLDHCHSNDNNQLVRGVINSAENVALGRIEGLYARFIGYWYEGTYPEFLRLTASYIDRGTDIRYRHPMWIKKVNTSFNSLSEGKKDSVLIELEMSTGKNSTERKKNFNKAVMSKKFSYNDLMKVLKKFK